MPRHALAGRHVVVTGASSGIGAELAVELGRRGAHVGLLARREEELRAVAERVGAAGGRVAFAPVDVTDLEALRQAVAVLESELGPVYGLVANAGIGAPTKRGRIDAERDGRILDVNVLGVVRAIAVVQPGILERKAGFLSAVSSLAGFRGLPGHAAYSASKAAVSTFLESLRVDLRGSGVTVTTIHPGFVRTPMTDRNRFRMPFLWPADRAARVIVEGLVRGRGRVDFPWPMVLAVKALRCLPSWLYERLAPAR